MIAASLTFLLAPAFLRIDDEELARRLAAAGGDVAALWDVRVWLEQQGRSEQARALLDRILLLAPEHEGAHRALAHHLHDGRWFETYTELSRHRRAEEQRMLAEHGQVRWLDGWVAQEDIAYLRLGWQEQPDGSWVDPRVAARRSEEQRLAGLGWQQQDLTWIPPEEFESWRAGLFKCGDEWLEAAAADAWHAQLGRWWRVPGEHFVVYTTLPRSDQSPEWAVWWADRTWDDLVRIFGRAPAEKPVFAAVDGIAQYNTLAAGDPALGLQPTELDGSSSVHYAYFAAIWFEDLGAGPEYAGRGVGWWDRADPALAPYGQHSLRHAAAQSFIEAIDPSWSAVGAMAAAGVTQTADFWAEKRIPRWLRYGAASYVERYFIDEQVGDGGDPGWARKWACANLRAQGGLRALEPVFAFALDSGDVEGSARLIHEAGLLVAFLLDGGDERVAAAHGDFTRALADGGDTTSAVIELQAALAAAEEQLRAFAE